MKLRVTVDGKAYDVEVEVPHDAEAERWSGGDAQFGLLTPAPLIVPAPPSGGAEEERVCRSPLAGIILRVNINAGQKLNAGDPIVVLEAMKMETNITAPASCVVKTVMVKPNEAVLPGQVLAEFE